jgi:hypothetical protein
MLHLVDRDRDPLGVRAPVAVRRAVLLVAIMWFAPDPRIERMIKKNDL